MTGHGFTRVKKLSGKVDLMNGLYVLLSVSNGVTLFSTYRRRFLFLSLCSVSQNVRMIKCSSYCY